MSAPGPASDLAIKLQIGDPVFAARLAALLGKVPGLRIAASGEPDDLILSSPDIADGGFEQSLTPRERDVIALLPTSNAS